MTHEAPSPAPATTTPTEHQPGRDAGGGEVAATGLAVVILLAALVWLAAPWRRERIPRARLRSRPRPEAPDDGSP